MKGMLFSLSMLMVLILISACENKITEEELSYIAEIDSLRGEINEYMKDSPNSPFNYKGKVEFHPLKYFKINPSFKFESKLYEHEKKDTVVIYGTKGEERYPVRFGYVKINYDETEYKVSVYESISPSSEKYYSIWFTDKTTNNETYGVGRYLEFSKQDDPEYIYTIDFNLAFNPYCAYSKDYSCAIPTKDDYIDLAIKAGEIKFHD